MASQLDTASQARNFVSNHCPVPFLDISRENGPLKLEFEEAIASVIDSGQFVLGPECNQLENDLAQLCETKHGIGCASGSDALLLALMACGLQPGDEVILPSFTFFATASAVWRLGGIPIFADVHDDTFCVTLDSVRELITERTRAIIPVHLFGQCAPMSDLLALTESERRVRGEFFLIEDAAQSIGAGHDGRPAGAWGDIGCFSFYPTKNLGGFGDGGMLTTSNDELADRMRLLRTHGMRPRYFHREVGINSRLDSIQAAVLRIKLRHLWDWTQLRRENAARYQALFNSYRWQDAVTVPTEQRGFHVWNQFTLRILNGQRDALRQYLMDRGIGTEVYYPVPLHQQECFRSLGYESGTLPVTERLANEVLSIPIFPTITEQEQRTVVRGIAEFFGVG